jgi:hypothetical protein
MNRLDVELIEKDFSAKVGDSAPLEASGRRVLAQTMFEIKSKNYLHESARVLDEPSSIEILAFYAGNFLYIILILPAIFSFFVVKPGEAKVIMRFGRVIKVDKNPGLKWLWPFGLKVRPVSMRLASFALADAKITDSNGSPLHVSATITLKVGDPIKYVTETQNVLKYTQTQGCRVLKSVVSKFPLRSNNPTTLSLLVDKGAIGRIMKELLAESAKVVGLEIISMELTECWYAPEIAMGLLQIQQAQSKLEAKKIIVEGCVGIAKEALDLLDKEGMYLSRECREQVLANLLLVTFSPIAPLPVLALT